MSTKRQAMTTAAALTLIASGAGGTKAPLFPKSHHATPKLRCDLPPRDYISTQRANSVSAVSFRAVLVRTPALEIPAEIASDSGRLPYAYYQLNVPRLGADHCSISRVALAIWEDGTYILSFRADQNAEGPIGFERILPGASVPTRTPLILPGSTATQQKFTAYIKRNMFTVKARGLGAYLAAEDPAVAAGHPVLFEIAPEPFWVQRGQPIFPRFVAHSREVAAFLRDVDRVEIELSYR